LDVKQIRYKNLQKLGAKFGQLSVLSEKLQSERPNDFTNARYFYQVKPEGRRTIGDKMARFLEEALELEHGWMDKDHDNYAPIAPTIDRSLLIECMMDADAGWSGLDMSTKDKADIVANLYERRLAAKHFADGERQA